jgi:hypothetical protein
MKTQLTILFVLITCSCFGQTEINNDAVCELKLSYRPVVINILSDTGIFSTSLNKGNISKMTYTSPPPGNYKIQISGQGKSTVIRDSIVVKEGQNLILNFSFTGPCLYDHPANYIPICPKKHKDNIIPIVYGLEVTRGGTFIKDSKEMKVKYAGCITTGCDPQFYCKEHNIEF